MLPVLLDNARLLASAYRNLSAAQNESRTEVRQTGMVLTLSSWKNGRMYRNSFSVEVRDHENHDRYYMEMRDVTSVQATSDKLVVQSDVATWTFKVVEELDSCKRHCGSGYREYPGYMAPPVL